MIKINGKIAEFPEVERGIDTLSYYLLKRLVKDAGLDIAKVVKRMNKQNPEHQTTSQNLFNKLSRDTLKLSEFIKLVELCGYDVSFDRVDEEAAQTEKTFSQLVCQGYADSQSVNFRQIVIAGAKAQEAAEFIKTNLYEGMDEAQEIILLITANRQYNVICKPVVR